MSGLLFIALAVGIGFSLTGWVFSILRRQALAALYDAAVVGYLVVLTIDLGGKALGFWP